MWDFKNILVYKIWWCVLFHYFPFMSLICLIGLNFYFLKLHCVFKWKNLIWKKIIQEYASISFLSLPRQQLNENTIHLNWVLRKNDNVTNWTCIDTKYNNHAGIMVRQSCQILLLKPSIWIMIMSWIL